MHVLKSLILSISMYSKIPMPQIECGEEDTKYTMMFFPLVGMLIAAAIIFADSAGKFLSLPDFARALAFALLPIAITGGFHLDGYMDTADARSSYQPRERKLEILKDSHIGAFAVIRVLVYELVNLLALSVLTGRERAESVVLVFALGFVLSRCLSGIAVVTFRSARKEGMLFYTARTSQRTANLIVLSVELVAVASVMLWIHTLAGILVLIAAAVCFVYYRIISYKIFGGITGDLAGWFVTLAECWIAVAAAVAVVLETMPAA